MTISDLLKVENVDYTDALKKELMEAHKSLHHFHNMQLSGTGNPGEPVTPETLNSTHTDVVRKMLSLEIPHEMVDSLDDTLPEELKVSVQNLSQPNEEDAKNLETEVLIAHHYQVHRLWKAYKTGKVDLKVSKEDLIKYHDVVLKEMLSRSVTHMHQDELDVVDGFIKNRPAENASTKDVNWLIGIAAIADKIKGETVLGLGDSTLSEALNNSERVVKGFSPETESPFALNELRNSEDGEYEDVFTFDLLGNTAEPEAMLLESERVSKALSVHFTSLKEGTNWSTEHELAMWLRDKDLTDYRVEPVGGGVILSKMKGATPEVIAASTFTGKMLIPGYVSLIADSSEAPLKMTIQDSDSIGDTEPFLRNTLKQLKLHDVKIHYRPLGPQAQSTPVYDLMLMPSKGKVKAHFTKPNEVIADLELSRPLEEFESIEECITSWAKPILKQGEPIYVEPKLEGERIRLATSENGVELFAGDTRIKNTSILKELNNRSTRMFDGILTLYDRSLRPRLDTIERLKGGCFPEDDVPIIWLIDCLMNDGWWLDNQTYYKRRAQMEKELSLHQTSHIKILPTLLANNVEEFREYSKKVLKMSAVRGVVYKRNAPYDWSIWTDNWATINTVEEAHGEVIKKAKQEDMNIYTVACIKGGERAVLGDTNPTRIEAPLGSILRIRLNQNRPEIVVLGESTAERPSIQKEEKGGLVRRFVDLFIAKEADQMLGEEGGEEGSESIKDTVGLIKKGDVGKYVLQIHNYPSHHLDFRLSIPSKPGWLAKYTIFIPTALYPRPSSREGYTAEDIKKCGEVVMDHLLKGEYLIGNVTEHLCPDEWLTAGEGKPQMLEEGTSGAGEECSALIHVIDSGEYSADVSFDGQHQREAQYDLTSPNITGWMNISEVSPEYINNPELLEMKGGVWLFSVRK